MCVFLGIALSCAIITTEDIALEAVYQVANAIDYKQTRVITTTDYTGTEMNPILGKHPTQKATLGYFVASAVGHAAITYILPQEYKTKWLYATAGFEVAVVGRNKYLGVKFGF